MTLWETPSFIEIDMSAEIGGYQGDQNDRQENPAGPDYAPDFVGQANQITSLTGSAG
jgi:coenzyme PQQ precursor peptide PqqA